MSCKTGPGIVSAMARKKAERGDKSLPLEMVGAAARFVERYRQHTGQTQDQLADAIGVSQFNISKCESGKGIGAAALVKLADHTGVLVDRIVERKLVDLDVAADYVGIDPHGRRRIRERAMGIPATARRPQGVREWVAWIEALPDETKAKAPAGAVRVDLRSELVPGAQRPQTARGRKR